MKLTETQIDLRLLCMPGWSLADGKLHCEYCFSGFVEAFRFMTAVALEAERLNHHPEWSNVWNRVTVDLSTHDAGGITEKDFTLAEIMNRWAQGSSR